MSGTMRVAVYYNNHDVRIEERPIPRIGPRELLVKVRASGICGSDVLEWYRVPKAPLVLGHEIAAEIVEVGGEVKGFGRGDRVFVSHHVPCLECAYCQGGHETVCRTLRTTNFDPGGFAEFVRVPEINVRHGVFRLPENLSWEDGVFVEPLACVVRGQRAADVRPGQSVLVIGSGMTGLLHIRLSRATGASNVFATDVLENRRDAAKASGADAVFRADEDVATKLKEANDSRLADRVILSTGAPAAIEQSFALVEAGGTILFFAPTESDRRIPMPFNRLWRDEVTMTSTYGASPRDLMESIRLLHEGRVKVRDLVSHRLPLTDAAKGFQLVADGRESLKVVLVP
jgi:L-iditol 2-dehydrogenase